ncbi:MAG: hypothetical protein IJH64_14235 [Oscillospiraceae bacterium]|nr:hypothetical protein [Oscillospiraceae bacterium]MBR0452287.1 hypothetical protein [Oscillospiraceae bacterium]
MRNLLIASMPFVLIVMTVLDAFFIARMFRQYRSLNKPIIPLLVGILCIGLFYDSLILSLGAFLKYGMFFKVLSQLRYILHATMIPLLLPICCYTFGNSKFVKPIWVITLLIMVIGLAAGVCTNIEPRTVGAISRYAVSDANPGWVDTVVQMLDIVPVFLMMGLGIVIWKKKRIQTFSWRDSLCSCLRCSAFSLVRTQAETRHKASCSLSVCSVNP